MKHILVILYSQTGQLEDIVNSITLPIKEDSRVKVTYKYIKPIKPYPYPWDVITFMDTFPESVHLVPCQIEPMDDENEYDLVILGYQVWFLSPSIPITSFLKSDYAKRKLKNKPVITIVGCRNMWIKAYEKVNSLLYDLDAKLIDNIVLTDQGPSYATFITTPRWLLTGEKDKFLGIFPPSGVSKKDIQEAKRFGFAILEALLNDKEKSLMPLCKGLKACNVDEKLITSEKIATKSFTIWGNFIRRFGEPGDQRRKPLVLLYLVFLSLIIVTVVPISMFIQVILRKLNPKKIKKLKQFYELPSGNDDYRMGDFSL